MPGGDAVRHQDVLPPWTPARRSAATADLIVTENEIFATLARALGKRVILFRTCMKLSAAAHPVPTNPPDLTCNDERKLVKDLEALVAV